MKSTQELRKNLQAFKYEGRERPFGYFYFQRWPSIFLTKFAIKHNLTPNQITMAGIILGVIGSIFMFFPLPFKIAGAILLYLNILSDKVDGEVARWRIQNNLGEVYLRGVFLDELNHLIIPPLSILMITMGIIHTFPYDKTFLTLMGTLAAISLPFLRINHSLGQLIFMKKYIKHPELFAPLPMKGEKDPISSIKNKHGLIRRLFFIIHNIQDFFIIVLLFFLAFISELILPIFRPSLLSGLLLMVLGFLLPLIVLENSIKGFFSIEHKVRDLKEKL